MARIGQTSLIVVLAGVFALVGFLLASAITGFGLEAQCVPGARSIHGFTPMIGGGEMAARLCAAEVPGGLWPWPVLSVVAGAAFGGILAMSLVDIMRRRADRFVSNR